MIILILGLFEAFSHSGLNHMNMRMAMSYFGRLNLAWRLLCSSKMQMPLGTACAMDEQSRSEDSDEVRNLKASVRCL